MDFEESYTDKKVVVITGLQDMYTEQVAVYYMNLQDSVRKQVAGYYGSPWQRAHKNWLRRSKNARCKLNCNTENLIMEIRVELL